MAAALAPASPLAGQPSYAQALQGIALAPQVADQAQDPAQAIFARNKAYLAPGEHTYNTPLAPEQEAQFRAWVAQNAVPFDPNAHVTDYDMRGFWKAIQEGDPRAATAVDPNDGKLHYNDYWKTPYHESFSNESQWANPATAPHWNEKDQLVAPDGRVLYDDRAPKGEQ
jgi:hypothetical protein